MYHWFTVALILRLIGLDGWWGDYAAGVAPVQDDGGSVWAMDGNEPPPPPPPKK